MRKLDPYVLENLILGDKYLALSQFVPPILPFDWDPEPYENMPGLDPAPYHQVSVLPGTDKELISPCVFSMMRDTANCLRAAHHIWTQADVDPNDEHRLFLRHQALIYHLLSLQPQNDFEECCRITLIILMLHATASVGASRSLQRMVHRLRVPLLRLKHQIGQDQLPLLFWTTSVGAMTTESPHQRDWFIKQISRIAVLLGLKPDKAEYQQMLERYLFLESVQGIPLNQLRRSVREMECEYLERESETTFFI